MCLTLGLCRLPCLPQPQTGLFPSPPCPRWLQNGHPAEELPGVQVASQGTTLHIDRVELGHAGLFACQATNEAGTATAEVELSVHGEEAWGSRAGVGEARGPWSSAPLAGLVDLGRVGADLLRMALLGWTPQLTKETQT